MKLHRKQVALGLVHVESEMNRSKQTEFLICLIGRKKCSFFSVQDRFIQDIESSTWKFSKSDA